MKMFSFFHKEIQCDKSLGSGEFFTYIDGLVQERRNSSALAMELSFLQ